LDDPHRLNDGLVTGVAQPARLGGLRHPRPRHRRVRGVDGRDGALRLRQASLYASRVALLAERWREPAVRQAAVDRERDVVRHQFGALALPALRDELDHEGWRYRHHPAVNAARAEQPRQVRWGLAERALDRTVQISQQSGGVAEAQAPRALPFGVRDD